MADLPFLSLVKKMLWLSGEKTGATVNGLEERCSQSVSSRRATRY